MVSSWPASYTDESGDCGYSATTNLTVIDSVYESCALGINQKTEGYFGGFGIDIPVGADIKGIEVIVNGKFDFGCSNYQLELHVLLLSTCLKVP